MSFNTIDLNTIEKEHCKVDPNATAPVKSRYPLMIYPNGMFDLSRMRGMYIGAAWLGETKDKYAVYVVFDDGTDFRISNTYDTKAEAKEELENYIRELWSIADDFEKNIPNFLK